YFNQTNSLADETNAVLVLSNAQPGQAGGYFVVASSETGSATSQVAQLSVAVPIGIVSAPTDQAATNGDMVTFAVTAQGAQPLMFQWYFNQTNSLVDQTNATLVLNNVSPADAGTYLVVVSNPYGIATSAPVSLTVLVPAAIITSPVDQIVAFGGTALFS